MHPRSLPARLAGTALAAALTLTLSACGPQQPPTEPVATAEVTQAPLVGVHPDGVDDAHVPDGYVAIRTGVAPVAVLPTDLDPNDPQLRAVVTDLLAQSMYSAAGDDFALELMQGAVVTDTARALHTHFGLTLTAQYPPTGPEGTWTVATYDPGTDAVTSLLDLTKDAADQAAAGAGGFLVTVDALTTPDRTGSMPPAN